PVMASMTSVRTAFCQSFYTPAFTTPPPLREATVAILTSASLHHPEQPDFGPADTSFRRLDPNRRDYVFGHWSQDVDQTGFGLDINVVFPIDRLQELAEAGVIGAVADVHLAYAGNQFDVAGVRMDSGPEGARLLREAGVDVVLLTPV
ncbi:MAG: glycine/sarcosine/betaine reductase selenoprotein B family protein, partial [Actinomycetota bacterium]